MADEQAGHAAEHTSHPHGNYFLIFAALCVLTALSVVADVVEIDNQAVLIVIVLAIAAAKALFVMAYFMHLKFEGRWKYVLLTPTLILACGLPLALLPDIGVHYYRVNAPQVDAAAVDGAEQGESPQPAESHGH